MKGWKHDLVAVVMQDKGMVELWVLVLFSCGEKFGDVKVPKIENTFGRVQCDKYNWYYRISRTTGKWNEQCDINFAEDPDRGRNDFRLSTTRMVFRLYVMITI